MNNLLFFSMLMTVFFLMMFFASTIRTFFLKQVTFDVSYYFMREVRPSIPFLLWIFFWIITTIIKGNLFHFFLLAPFFIVYTILDPFLVYEKKEMKRFVNGCSINLQGKFRSSVTLVSLSYSLLLIPLFYSFYESFFIIIAVFLFILRFVFREFNTKKPNKKDLYSSCFERKLPLRDIIKLFQSKPELLNFYHFKYLSDLSKKCNLYNEYKRLYIKALKKMDKDSRNKILLSETDKEVLELFDSQFLLKEFNRQDFVVLESDYKRGLSKERNYKRKYKMDILNLFDNRCIKCSSNYAIEMDHFFIPKNDGGCFLMKTKKGLLINNMVPLCSSCNREKSDGSYKNFLSEEKILEVQKKLAEFNKKLNQ